METKKSFKEKAKEFWTEEGPKIKVGLKCLAIGLGVGFVKGVITSSEMHAKTIGMLVERLPYEKDCDEDDPELQELIRLEEEVTNTTTEKEEA